MSDNSRPMGEMNTTPLIDVMLVLLIMFIITIPIATNGIEVDLPGEPGTTVPDPVKNRVVISEAGAILWNGEPVSDRQFVGLLQDTKLMVPMPELQFAPSANASYDRSAKVLDLVRRVGVGNFAFADTHLYARFDR